MKPIDHSVTSVEALSRAICIIAWHFTTFIPGILTWAKS